MTLNIITSDCGCHLPKLLVLLALLTASDGRILNHACQSALGACNCHLVLGEVRAVRPGDEKIVGSVSASLFVGYTLVR